MGVEDVIREAFTDAKAYKASWDDYNARTRRGEIAIPPARDLKLEPLVEVLEGKRLVHAHCYRQDEILMLLHVADEFGFKIRTLQHALEGYKVAKEIAAHGTGVVHVQRLVGVQDGGRRRHSVQCGRDDAQGRAGFAELGRRRADPAPEYRSRQDHEIRRPHRNRGLSLITINPAKQLRIDKRVGSIEVGKDADMVIYDDASAFQLRQGAESADRRARIFRSR